MKSSCGIPESLTLKKLEPVFVRPTAKTFNGLYFLSNLDFTHPAVIELVFVFKGDERGGQKATEVIRESLAKILVQFYPLSGHLITSWDGKMMVRCTGEGVPFVEAIAANEIDVLGDISIIDPVKLRKLVHFVDGAQNKMDIPLLTVQVTRFKCGGIVLGIGMNHAIVDGVSLTDFVISWAETARGMTPSTHPFLDRSILSPRQPLEINFPHHEYLKKENVTKNTTHPFPPQQQLAYQSFCFKPEKLSQLKKMATDDPFITPPTSFEVISALVWIAWSKALCYKTDQKMNLLIAVDGRNKFKPPLPNGYFGNCVAWACAQCSAGDLSQKPFSFAVNVVQEAIRVVTEEYMRSAIDYYEATRAEVEIENTCYISKWSRLPFYDTDFGWGEPRQVAPVSLGNNLILTLLQGKGSENIVVSMGLPVSAMKIFQELIYGELIKLE